MTIGEYVISLIKRRRDEKQKNLPGPHGDFYRNGGIELLYDLPVNTGSLVIDVGGYAGIWSSTMIARYGCRSEIFEPFPAYFNNCKRIFQKNELVRVHDVALGGSERNAEFIFTADGTSEFIKKHSKSEIIKVKVIDVSKFFDHLSEESISCMKLNIEGGEYEVLERLISSNQVGLCKSFLIQFHSQPNGWQERLKVIETSLKKTHTRVWCYPMVWEKWVRHDSL
jgi:FkbM family methyltransferase